MITPVAYYSDGKRHLVCTPYSIENLHLMAEALDIKRCWFHKDHYDVPKGKMLPPWVRVVSPKDIVRIINGEKI